MRLLPRLAMLFACLPLLLPPGLCACGASEVQTTPTRANVVTEAPKETKAPKCCGCSRHTKNEAPATQLVSPVPSEPEHAADHAPGCPATAERSNATERAEPVDHLTAVGFVVVPAHRSALAQQAPSAFAGARSTAPPHFPPLYLTHCALLI